MNSVDILKTDAPIAKIYTHMNRAYLFLEQNSEHFRGQDYNDMVIVATAYGEDADGNLNPDDTLSSWNRTYPQYQINKRVEEDGFPPYNIWIGLENYWYEIQLSFSFQNGMRDTSGNTYESKISVYRIDNRKTTLTSQFSSQFFTGTLRDNLQKKNYFNIYFGDTTQVKELNDLVSNPNGTIIKQITDVYGPPSDPQYQLLETETNYLNLVKYIINHKDTPEILYAYFKGQFPDYDIAEFIFKLYLNSQNYFIHFKGNFQFIMDRYSVGTRTRKGKR